MNRVRTALIVICVTFAPRGQPRRPLSQRSTRELGRPTSPHHRPAASSAAGRSPTGWRWARARGCTRTRSCCVLRGQAARHVSGRPDRSRDPASQHGPRAGGGRVGPRRADRRHAEPEPRGAPGQFRCQRPDVRLRQRLAGSWWLRRHNRPQRRRAARRQAARAPRALQPMRSQVSARRHRDSQVRQDRRRPDRRVVDVC